MKITWTNHYSLTKRASKGAEVLFHYAEGVSQVSLKCSYCKKRERAIIKKVKSEKGYLHWSKICPKCKVSMPLTGAEKRRLS